MLTDEQCNEFRRLPMSFNDMVRAIYEAGRASRFDDVHETLAKARAYLETGGWTKVSDGLPVVPEDAKVQLIWVTNGQTIWRRMHGKEYAATFPDAITHWRYAEPTPEPPKG